ncbi:MAG: ATP-binding protein [Bryobacteraceae bacterium]
MGLRARLTLYSVLLMATIVGVVSALHLAHAIELQFFESLERGKIMQRISVDAVTRTLDRERSAPLNEALTRDEELSNHLLNILTAATALLEIAVTDTHGRILADSDPSRVGMIFTEYPNFESMVLRTPWWGKLPILFSDRQNYELTQALAEEGQKAPVLFVRVVISPSLIRAGIRPILETDLGISLASILGSILVALVFTGIVYRPLGAVGRMIDVVTGADYEGQPGAEGDPGGAAPPPEELKAVASKLNLLGQQLRGARHDFSDLRGNVERLLDELEDAVLVFGRQQRLVTASGAIEKFLGRKRTELIGMSLSEIFAPTTNVGLLLAQIAETGRPVRNRHVSIPSGASGKVSRALLSVDIVQSLGAANGLASHGIGLLVRFRDPEATHRIGSQLQLAERLSSIGRITGGVAHEVKNPLNAINIHVELARTKLSHGDTDIEPEMEIISGEILRLDRVVTTFLDFNRPLRPNLQDIAVDTLLEDLVRLTKPQAEAAGVSMAVSLDSEGAVISADADLLKQAMLNVVVNAIASMPKGGELRIETSVYRYEAEIRIADTGMGIAPELRDKIFKLYFSTKKGGSGIGLAMAFRIVQLHDGTIDFTSETGKGTTFSLRFPLAPST